jgi:hypothetical protein
MGDGLVLSPNVKCRVPSDTETLLPGAIQMHQCWRGGSVSEVRQAWLRTSDVSRASGHSSGCSCSLLVLQVLLRTVVCHFSWDASEQEGGEAGSTVTPHIGLRATCDTRHLIPWGDPGL